MSKQVWAQPGMKWDGFKPVAYSLDTQKVWKLPLTEATAGKATTIGQVIEAFRNQKVEVDDSIIETTLKSDAQTMVLKGPQFNQQLLRLYYALAEKGASPFGLSWYYYDHDSSNTSPQESYSFFLVWDDKIIDEEFRVSDYHDSGFEPTIFVPNENDGIHWSGVVAWEAAIDKYYYRKFYAETRTGQLMTLRPDKPTLYHYADAKPVNTGLVAIHKSLATIKTVLWIVAALLALDIYLHWK